MSVKHVHCMNLGVLTGQLFEVGAAHTGWGPGAPPTDAIDGLPSHMGVTMSEKKDGELAIVEVGDDACRRASRGEP